MEDPALSQKKNVADLHKSLSHFLGSFLVHVTRPTQQVLYNYDSFWTNHNSWSRIHFFILKNHNCIVWIIKNWHLIHKTACSQIQSLFSPCCGFFRAVFLCSTPIFFCHKSAQALHYSYLDLTSTNTDVWVTAVTDEHVLNCIIYCLV